MKQITIRLIAVLLIAAMPVSTLMQSGGSFQITKSVIATGGGASSGGSFSLASTVGQSVAGNALTGGSFAVTSGFWNFTVNPAAGFGLEGDVAARPTGDGTVASNDVVQTQRFQIGLDQPNQSNEFQRADSAPFAAKGDGAIDSTDVVQTQRYQIGLNAPQAAAGPIDSSGLIGDFETDKLSPPNETTDSPSSSTLVPTAPRELRAQGTTTQRGQPTTVNIVVDAMGDESAYGFTATYNPAVLTNPTTMIGTAGGSRLCNPAIVGEVRCSVNTFLTEQPGSSTDQIGEILPGNNQLLLKITFTVATDAPFGATPISLTNVNASNDAAAALTITSQNGNVTVLAPTAALVTVGGKVLTADGRGIRNARVTLTAPDGQTRTAITAAFGNYRFENVAAGETYVISVSAKRFSFSQPTQVRFIGEEISDINFIANY